MGMAAPEKSPPLAAPKPKRVRKVYPPKPRKTPGPKGPHRKNRRESAIEIRVKQRRVHVLEARKGGLTFREIADKFRGTEGFPERYSDVAAFQDYQHEMQQLKAVSQETAEELRNLDLARLDTLLKALKKRADEGDPKSINTVLRVMERRAKMLGYDEPDKVMDVTNREDVEAVRRVVYAKLLKKEGE